jgi:hypothetical protein
VVFSVRVLTALAVAAVAGINTDAHAQTVDELRPSISEDAGAAETDSLAPDLPSLAISESETPEPPARRARQRAADPFAPQGIDLGGLRLYPAIEAGAIVSSNIRQSSVNKQAGAGLSVSPSLRLESDWLRHSWQTSLRGNYTAYAKDSGANTGSLEASSRFRLDIRRTTTADFEAAYALTPTRPDDTGLAGGAEGLRLDQTGSASAALTQHLGGISVQFKTGLERQLYGDEDLAGGGTRDNSNLNFWKPSASLRLTYSDAPALQPFIEAGYARRLHDEDDATDSGDIDLRLGTSFDDGAIWSGEIALTYLRRDYKDDALGRLQAFGINGNLTWRPTELTAVVAEAETSLDDASTDGRNYGLRLNISHEARENLVLEARTSLLLERNAGADDITASAGAGLSYQFTPELAWTAGYDMTVFRADNPAQDFTDHRVSVGLVLRR